MAVAVGKISSPVDYEGLWSFSRCFLPHSCPHTKFCFEKPKLEPFALSFPFSSTAFFLFFLFFCKQHLLLMN